MVLDQNGFWEAGAGFAVPEVERNGALWRAL